MFLFLLLFNIIKETARDDLKHSAGHLSWTIMKLEYNVHYKNWNEVLQV